MGERSAILDTNESRNRHARTIRYVSPIFGTSPSLSSGWLYVCPRCEWASPVMAHRVGATRHADEHALTCSGVV